MKQDKDLTFLSSCKNDDLRTLCDILTHNKNGELRLSEQLTNSDAYIKCYPEQMSLMTNEIGEELRKYGSNTVMTLCRRGEADNYETIVRRVCKKLGVKVGSEDTVAEMENSLLTEVCQKAVKELSEEELRSLADEAGIPHKNLNAQMLGYVLMIAARRNVYLLTTLSYYLITRIANILLGRGVTMIGMSTVGRYVGMAAGPIGWALLTGWTVSDLASPAYRVIIPAVIMVATLRLQSVERRTA